MYHHLSLNMIDSSPHVLQRPNPSVQLRDGSYHYRNLVVDVDNSLVILETIVTFIAFTQILSLRHQTTTKHHHSRNASLPLSVFFDSLNLFERSNSNNQTNRAPTPPVAPQTTVVPPPRPKLPLEQQNLDLQERIAKLIRENH
jgi:hypothetical protein